MSQLGTPDYRALADRAIQVYNYFAAQHPDAKRDHSSKEPRCRREFGSLDFEEETPRELDRYLAGNFVEDSRIGKLESDVEGEEGLYNVAIEPSLRTPFALVMPTRDYHSQSAPLRTPYLVHAYRLLIAMEDRLNSTGGAGGKVMAVYDCGEKSGVITGHKCIRFFTASTFSLPSIAHKSYPLYIYSNSATKEGEVFASLLRDGSSETTPRIPQQPHYNLIMTRQELIIVPRIDDGFLEDGEGRWDGARLCGIHL